MKRRGTHEVLVDWVRMRNDRPMVLRMRSTSTSEQQKNTSTPSKHKNTTPTRIKKKTHYEEGFLDFPIPEKDDPNHFNAFPNNNRADYEQPLRFIEFPGRDEEQFGGQDTYEHLPEDLPSYSEDLPPYSEDLQENDWEQFEEHVVQPDHLSSQIHLEDFPQTVESPLPILQLVLPPQPEPQPVLPPVTIPQPDLPPHLEPQPVLQPPVAEPIPQPVQYPVLIPQPLLPPQPEPQPVLQPPVAEPIPQPVLPPHPTPQPVLPPHPTPQPDPQLVVPPQPIPAPQPVVPPPPQVAPPHPVRLLLNSCMELYQRARKTAEECTNSEIAELRKTITGSFNQVTRKRTQIEAKVEILTDLLDSHLRKPKLYQFACFHIADSLRKQMGVNHNAEAVFQYAHVVVLISRKHTAVLDVVFGYFCDICPYVIPEYPKQKGGQSLNDYKMHSLKYQSKLMDDGGYQVEEEEKYSIRMTGIVRLFSSILVLKWRQGRHEEIRSLMWYWLASFLNFVDGENPTLPHVLLSFLEQTGHFLLAEFRGQFVKLMGVVRDFIRVLPPSEPSKIRLDIFLIEFQKTHHIDKPKGIEME
eukprot:TRINITY_DN2391_c0_g1_i1.p1 TRINITY_DN2391_c0_g1~~TRINITY_DN2391_c0_g1_i1.p1  ORF type:complete len:581 (+),score=100.01 TRINITY_DN2391_c0_g1_i1:2-1744(+)